MFVNCFKWYFIDIFFLLFNVRICFELLVRLYFNVYVNKKQVFFVSSNICIYFIFKSYL